jgi:hypothetical protein
MKKSKESIYFRYEFSDETGTPEGADIFEFSNFAKAEAMATEILKVAHGDQVAVSLTIGREKPFFKFLDAAGLSRKDAELEFVNQKAAKTAAKKTTKKKASKKKK